MSAASASLLCALALVIAAAPAAARTRPPDHAIAAGSGGLDPALARLAIRSPRAQVGVIIQFLPRISPTQALRVARSHGARREVVLRLIHGLAAQMSARAAAAMARLKVVHAVSLNTRVHSQDVQLDPSKLASWWGQSADLYPLWGAATGNGVGVAVIDSGVEGDLPDFRSSPDDAGSRVTTSAVVNPFAVSAGDSYGHGTMVAGLVGGDGDARGSGDPEFGKYIGAAPQANLISIKVGDDQGNATVLDVLYGIQFAIDHRWTDNIRVINLSLESSSPQSYRTDPLDAAVEAAWFSGILVVTAAGNQGSAPGAVNFAPANDPFVITVGAVADTNTVQNLYKQTVQKDRQKEAAISDPAARQAQYQRDQRSEQALLATAGLPASFSSRGTTQDGYSKPDLYAPGAHIVSDLAPASAFQSMCPACVSDGQYIMASGTSLAAPIVAGIAADLLQAHPHWSPRNVKGALLSTAVPVSGINGAGMLDANAALNATHLSSDWGMWPSSYFYWSSPYGQSWATWDRSSWSTASGGLNAPWARSSWSCMCSRTSDGSIDPTRSSWSSTTWGVDFAAQ